MKKWIVSTLLVMALFAKGFADPIQDAFAQGITVDVHEPTYCDGVLQTERGGVITAPGVRIQARSIAYTCKENERGPIRKIVAEGDVMVNYGTSLYVGRRVEYDFVTETGFIEDGRGAMDPWYFGGARIDLLPNACIIIHDAYFTTSENVCNEWDILAKKAVLTNYHYLVAKNVQFRLMKWPIFWFPYLKMDMDFIYDTPIRYYVRMSGRRGTRIGILYKLYTIGRWRLYARLDYRLFRGPGGGFETKYKSRDHKARFETINYVARDNSISDDSQRFRYRFQGSYHHLLLSDKVTVNLNYDKLSDKDMATDYQDLMLKFAIAERTQLLLRRQDFSWIASLIAKPRANTFQTLKQELPTIEISARPINVGRSGLIMDNTLRGSYLDFDYTNKIRDASDDYSSFRYEYNNRLYRSLSCRYLTLTPQAAGVVIFYQNSPKRKPQLLAIGLFETEANTSIYRFYNAYKHLLKPYIRYQYYTFPTSKPNQHYIFDIDDGWFRLNSVRFGILQNLYSKETNGCVNRPLMADLFAYAFIDTKTIDLVIPRVYGNLVYQFSPFMKHVVEAAWDFKRKQVAHFNVRCELTFSENVAFAGEYRHRNAYDWRKVEHNNFILDSFRSEKELRRSSLSDRRDTLLLHLFYRFHPSWALECISRQGWDRIREPNYIEAEVNIIGRILSAWDLRIVYAYKEHEHRIGGNLSLGLKEPNRKRCCPPPCVEF